MKLSDVESLFPSAPPPPPKIPVKVRVDPFANAPPIRPGKKIRKWPPREPGSPPLTRGRLRYPENKERANARRRGYRRKARVSAVQKTPASLLRNRVFYRLEKMHNKKCPRCGAPRLEPHIYCFRHYVLRMFIRRGLHRSGHWVNGVTRDGLVAFLYGRYKTIATYGDGLLEAGEDYKLPDAAGIWAVHNFLIRLPVGDTLQRFQKAVSFLDGLARKEYNAKQRSDSDGHSAP